MWLQFSCCGVDGPQDFLDSAWYNRTVSSGVLGVYVPQSCCVDRPTGGAAESPVVLAAAKVIDCQHMAKRYIHNPNGPDPSSRGTVHFLQTQVLSNFQYYMIFLQHL